MSARRRVYTSRRTHAVLFVNKRFALYSRCALTSARRGAYGGRGPRSRVPRFRIRAPRFATPAARRAARLGETIRRVHRMCTAPHTSDSAHACVTPYLYTHSVQSLDLLISVFDHFSCDSRFIHFTFCFSFRPGLRLLFVREPLLRCCSGESALRDCGGNSCGGVSRRIGDAGDGDGYGVNRGMT